MRKIICFLMSIPLLVNSATANATPFTATPMTCNLTMAQTFSDGMVLQNTDAVVGGLCTEPANISAVLLNNVGAEIESVQGSCKGGRFLIELKHRAPSADQFHIRVLCGGRVAANASNIMFGTVILCGGQSNMGFTTGNEDDAPEELAKATSDNYPLVRLFGLKTQNTSAEAPAVVRRWQQGWANLTKAGEKNPKGNPVAQFSAVCWNMGKELSARLESNGTKSSHPIGLIDAAVGSTRVECWMPPAAVKKTEGCWRAHPSKNGLGNCTHVSWSGPPSVFYHGMIEPLSRSVRVAAMVYYQGENNMWDVIDAYHCSGDALAAGWREAFKATSSSPVPWFIVQLAPCCGDNDGLVAGSDIREAQRRSSLTVSDAHLVVLNDIGDAGKNPSKHSGFAPATHPKNKTEPGRRVGMQVWQHVFNTDSVAATIAEEQLTGPILQSVSFTDGNHDAVRVDFEPKSASGLHWMPTHNCSVWKTVGQACCNTLTQSAQFSNASTPDASYNEYDFWVDAPASIQGTSLIAHVPADVGVPRWMRIQYKSQPPCVLANSALLPTSLFVTEIAPAALVV